MSVTVTVTKKQGSTMGTVIARVSDPGVIVQDVNFYIAVPPRSSELGPYPPDIVRRPSPGVYEKDVVLDAEFKTLVRIEVLTEPGGTLTFNGSSVQEFDARTGTVGGTGEVRVKDANTGPTAAETLSIEGATVTVSVPDRVATFNLDGHYATQTGLNGALAGYYTKAVSDERYAQIGHTHAYVPLGGGTITGGLNLSVGNLVLGADPNGALELGNSLGSGTPFIDFHKGVGAAQDFNARIINNAANSLHVQFAAGVGTFNVAGTIAQGGIPVSLSDHHHNGLYAPASHSHEYLPLAGGTVGSTFFAAGLTVQGGMRFANGGSLQAYRTDGTVENVFWPRWTDNNTYLNYGSGGYFYIRDNANNQRLTFAPEGAAFTTWVQARGPSGHELRLGGSRDAAMACITTTPNLHLDSPNGWNIYLNHVSDRPVNIGAINQSAYKLAVSGDALVTGWFRNSQPGQGLYNEALGRHLYAGMDVHNSGWNITGGAGETFLALRDAHGSAPRGWLFSSAGGFGLLHSGRWWAVRVHTAGVQLYGSTYAESLQVNGSDPNYRVYVGGSIKVAGNLDVGGNMFDPYGRPLASYEVSGGTPAQAGNPAARHGTLWLVVE
jgi:hypothetical protein